MCTFIVHGSIVSVLMADKVKPWRIRSAPSVNMKNMLCSKKNCRTIYHSSYNFVLVKTSRKLFASTSFYVLFLSYNSKELKSGANLFYIHRRKLWFPEKATLEVVASAGRWT